MTTTTSSKIGTESPNPPRLAPPAAPVGFRMVLKLGLLAGRGQRKLTSIEPPQARPSKLTTNPQPPSLKGGPLVGQPRNRGSGHGGWPGRQGGGAGPCGTVALST